MSYHLATPSKKQLTLTFPEHIIYYEGFENFHIAGMQRPYLPVTLNSHIDNIGAARWKLLPFWVKNEEAAVAYANTLNAEAETIFEKVSYKNYIEKNRGLLYVNGFFEPPALHLQTNTPNYFIYKPNKEIFTLGIVYANFTNQDNAEVYPTFAIITTPANPLLMEINKHNQRMPLIIAEEDRKTWLEDDTPSTIQHLMKLYEGMLEYYEVQPFSDNSLHNDNNPSAQNPI